MIDWEQINLYKIVFYKSKETKYLKPLVHIYSIRFVYESGWKLSFNVLAVDMNFQWLNYERIVILLLILI
jgi:hypothetical protein